MFFISLEGKAFMHTKVSKFYYMNNLPEILSISEKQASANQSLKSKGHILRQDLSLELTIQPISLIHKHWGYRQEPKAFFPQLLQI